MLLLGEKKSEEPYGPADRGLLQALAGQLGQVCERAWLEDRVDQESRIRREVLAHLDSEVNLLQECPQCGACFGRDARICPEDGSELTCSLPVEHVIEGKYRLERRIGRGGMGAVYEATDLRLRRSVAVKILTGSLFGNRLALRRFEREARATARLVHQNVVSIYDFGALGCDGAYLVMELLRGMTWRGELNRCIHVAPELAISWFDQLLSGLAAAHNAGIIHRDLKPENVLISDGCIKILDFGLAKIREGGGDTHSETVAGTVLGTVGYMAPEQLLGQASDERSDIFAVGVMLAEVVSGRRPFPGGQTRGSAYFDVEGGLRLPGDGRAIDGLNAVLGKCLAKNPQNRFQTTAELRPELIGALSEFTSFRTWVPDAGESNTRTMPGGPID